MNDYLENVNKLSQYLRTKILDDSNSDDTKSSDLPSSFLGDHLEIYIYGEWIHRNCQTSDSKEDKYKYKDRGLYPGHLYAFGVGVVLCEDATIDSFECPTIDRIMDRLANIDQPMERSYIVKKCMDINDKPFLIMVLNQSLKELLDSFGFDVVPILAQSHSIENGISKFGRELLPPNIKYEGIIFTGKNILKAIKLKNPIADGNDPKNMERYSKFKKYIEELYHPSMPLQIQRNQTMLLKTIKRFMDYHNKSSNVDKSESHSQIQFERAYYSAKSKFPFFSDECNMKTEIQDQERDSAFNEILEKYKRTIKNEMLKDLANDETTSTSAYLDQLIIDRIKFDLNISKEL